MDARERTLAGEMQSHHHHPRHPEEQDVEAGDEHRSRVEVSQVGGLLRPAEGRERPQRRREPGVEHVAVLGEPVVPGLGRSRLAGAGDEAVAGRVVPGRDLMPPPQLARDAPRSDVRQPVLPGLAPRGRDELQASVVVRRERLGRHRRNVAEPLRGHQRLDADTTALAEADVVQVVLFVDQQSSFAKLREQERARRVDVEAGERLARCGGHPSLAVDHLNARQAVAAAGLEIRRVVVRRDLDHAGAEVALDRVVGDERDLAPRDRNDGELPDEMPVALVLGVHGEGSVAEQRLGPRRRDDDALGAARDRIGDLPELVLDLPHLDFEIGDRGVQPGGPVHQVFAAGDPPLLEQAHERFADGQRKSFVESEALTRPVARRPEEIELAADVPLILLLPGPDALEERLAAEVVAGLALFRQIALDHQLRRDAGVVGPRQPEGVAPLHSAPAGEQILQGGLQRMPHVQLAGDVRRRDHDAVGLWRRRTGGIGRSDRSDRSERNARRAWNGAGEVALRRPLLLPAALVALRVETLVHLADWSRPHEATGRGRREWAGREDPSWRERAGPGAASR